MDGNEEKKIDDILIKNFTVQHAEHPYYLMNTDKVIFENSSVNGEAVPQTPEQSTEKVTLDVY